MAFTVGQKVTRIHDTPFGGLYAHEIVPQFSLVYTIRSIIEFEGELGLTFAEIRNAPVYPYGLECFFAADEFRPVVERKTDISIFTEMLAPKSRRKAHA